MALNNPVVNLKVVIHYCEYGLCNWYCKSWEIGDIQVVFLGVLSLSITGSLIKVHPHLMM